MLLYTNFRNKRESKNNSRLKYSALWNVIWTNRNEWKRIESKQIELEQRATDFCLSRRTRSIR